MINNLIIRRANQCDLNRLVNIYNQAIIAGEKTADVDTFTVLSRQKWFDEHNNNNYPLITAEYEGIVVGYASLSAYRPGRRAFINTVEISYYVDSAYHGKKIGATLMKEILEYAEKLKYQTAIAMLIDTNTISINLLDKFGFERWGLLPDIAEFAEKKAGHLFYGKKL